jgi:hypothetical protein
VNKSYSVDDVRESLKKKVVKLKELFSTKTIGWNLDALGLVQCSNFSLGREVIGEATNIESGYLQFASVPVTLSGYFSATSPVIPTDMLEMNHLELLDYLYTQSKLAFPKIATFWKDVAKPISLDNFPALGIFTQEQENEQKAQTSTEHIDTVPILRVYSSLATKEVAFINHLRNVETIKTWILNNPFLNGYSDAFKLQSIDYGIDSIGRAFQGSMQEYPVFRSDITTTAALMSFKDA